MADTAPQATEAPTAIPATQPETQPKDAAQKDAAPPKLDPRAELNERIKSAGIKLKAKDREIPVSSLDDLVSRANRVFGVESLLEEAKTKTSEAEQVKAWKSAMEADDANAAGEAFDALSPKAQRNALQWLQRKAQAAQEEESLSPRERELRAALESSERQRREFERRDMETRRAREEQEAAEELSRTRNMAAEMAMKTLESMKAPKDMAPALLPRVARVLRVGLEAGVQLSPEEVANEVRDGLLSEHRMLTDGMDGEGLIALMGEDMAKKVARAFLARRRQAPPTQEQANAVSEVKPPKTGDTDSSLRGTPRFFR